MSDFWCNKVHVHNKTHCDMSKKSCVSSNNFVTFFLYYSALFYQEVHWDEVSFEQDLVASVSLIAACPFNIPRDNSLLTIITTDKFILQLKLMKNVREKYANKKMVKCSSWLRGPKLIYKTQNIYIEKKKLCILLPLTTLNPFCATVL